MATINYTSSTNNVNQLLFSWSTVMEYFSDRKVGSSVAARASIVKLQGLGVSVTTTNPFTSKSS